MRRWSTEKNRILKAKASLSNVLKNPSIRKLKMEIAYRHLENASYQKTWDLQENIRKRVMDSDLSAMRVLSVEHQPVITFGRAEKGKNLLGDPTWLEKNGIQVIKSNRGGMVTYHGPGQLVVYPVIHLKELNTSVKCFVHSLEEVMIQICQTH